MYVQGYNEARSRNHCCRGKAINITHSECVPLSLVIQQAARMRRLIFSSVACPAVPYFSTLKYKALIFGGKIFFEHKMCGLYSLKFLFEIFLILRIFQRGIFMNVQRFS